MSRNPDTRKIDLANVFLRVQKEMLSHLSVSNLLEHSATHGAESEQEWIRLFDLYLPTRFRSAPCFVINSDGRRSRQIDLAIFDTFSSPQLFARHTALYIPIESVYATFEIKSNLNVETLSDAGKKAASVRQLRSDPSRPILAGVLAPTSVWVPRFFSAKLARNLDQLPHLHNIDLGCALQRGSFEFSDHLTVSPPHEALIFFLLRLADRLDALGPPPRLDLMRYARGIRSFEW